MSLFLSFFVSHKALLGLEAILRDGKPVGFMRRGDYGFSIGKSLSYGYVTNPSGEIVNSDYLKSGSYIIESMGEQFPAEIHLKAPFDQKNLRVKGDYS